MKKFKIALALIKYLWRYYKYEVVYVVLVLITIYPMTQLFRILALWVMPDLNI